MYRPVYRKFVTAWFTSCALCALALTSVVSAQQAGQPEPQNAGQADKADRKKPHEAERAERRERKDAERKARQDGQRTERDARKDEERTERKARKEAEKAEREAQKEAERVERKARKEAERAERKARREADRVDHKAEEKTGRRQERPKAERERATDKPTTPVQPKQEAAQPQTEERPANRERATKQPATPAQPEQEAAQPQTEERPANRERATQEREERRARERDKDRTTLAPEQTASAHTAVSSKRKRNEDGTETIVRTRRDGATVTILRDAKGRVIRRRVDGDRPRRDLRHSRDLQVVKTREERFDNGRTRIIRTRDDGSQLIIVRDRDGEIIRRAVRDRSGRDRYVFKGHRRHKHRYRRDNVYINLYVPFALPIEPEIYVVEARYAEPGIIRETFLAPPVWDVEERYSIDEVRQNADVRAAVRQVDVDAIHFPTGKYEIPESQIAQLDRIARVIRSIVDDNPDEVFLIEGHTDAVGSWDYNLELSQLRADAVKQALVDTYDISPEYLESQGYGEEYLKIDTEGNEPRNRRVTMRRITDLVRG